MILWGPLCLQIHQLAQRTLSLCLFVFFFFFFLLLLRDKVLYVALADLELSL